MSSLTPGRVDEPPACPKRMEWREGRVRCALAPECLSTPNCAGSHGRTARPGSPAVRAHETGIDKHCFDLIATGRKPARALLAQLAGTPFPETPAVLPATASPLASALVRFGRAGAGDVRDRQQFQPEQELRVVVRPVHGVAEPPRRARRSRTQLSTVDTPARDHGRRLRNPRGVLGFSFSGISNRSGRSIPSVNTAARPRSRLTRRPYSPGPLRASSGSPLRWAAERRRGPADRRPQGLSNERGGLTSRARRAGAAPGAPRR